MPDDVTSLSAVELLDAFARRGLDPVEVAEATLTRIDRLEPDINAFVTVTAERARADAQRASAAWADGTAGPLCGVPYSLKDLAVTKGIPTGRGSLVWGVDDAGFDAPVAERLAGAGGVLLGKTTTPEMGWKGDSGNRRNGPCHNPWRHGRTPGGSSGGTAAAAVAGYGPLHQGSDGGRLGAHPGELLRRGRPEADVRPDRAVPGERGRDGVAHRPDHADGRRLRADARRDGRAGRARSHVRPDRRARPTSARCAQPLDPLRIAFSPDLGFGVVEPGVATRVAARRPTCCAASGTGSRRSISVSTTRGGSRRRSGTPAWPRSTSTGSARCATCSIPASSR